MEDIEKIKEGLKQCSDKFCKAGRCPYGKEDFCTSLLHKDALKLIIDMQKQVERSRLTLFVDGDGNIHPLAEKTVQSEGQKNMTIKQIGEKYDVPYNIVYLATYGVKIVDTIRRERVYPEADVVRNLKTVLQEKIEKYTRKAVECEEILRRIQTAEKSGA